MVAQLTVWVSYLFIKNSLALPTRNYLYVYIITYHSLHYLNPGEQITQNLNAELRLFIWSN